MRPRTLQGRLALVFGLATFVTASLLGVILFVQFQTALRSALDDDLTTRFHSMTSLLAQSEPLAVDPRVAAELPETESFAQVVSPGGEVLTASPKALLKQPVVSKAELERAGESTQTLVRRIPPDGESVRLRVGPARIGGEPVVVVVGTSLEQTSKAEHHLAVALGLGLPLFAVLVSIGGWFLAGAALRPVRSMVTEADELAAREPGQRLSIPVGGEELAELARRLNHLLDRIEAAMVHERAFLDDASHELRTPIAIVRGEVELARMAAADDPDLAGGEVARSLDSTLEEVERLDRLAGNLLVLARTRAGQPGAARRVDLGALTRRAVTNAERAFRNQRDVASVDVEVDGNAVALGDETALERAVGNVVENALRHARRHVAVVIGVEAPNAVVVVRDDGPGFPPEILPHVFDRFARDGSSRGSSDGAGLGLAIVEAIAIAHGGRATARNGADGGAEVRLELLAPT